MIDNTDPQPGSAATRLAVGGSLVTGIAGIAMAIFSVLGGEETGGAALLAASALAFGLLATNLDRTLRNLGLNKGTPQKSEVPEAAETGAEAKLLPASTFGIDGIASLLNVSRVNGGLVIRPRDATVAQIDAQPITEREREVLSLVAEGHSNKLISSDLGISERTVKNHLTSTMTKLRASDRTHAVVTAVRAGWLDI